MKLKMDEAGYVVVSDGMDEDQSSLAATPRRASSFLEKSRIRNAKPVLRGAVARCLSLSLDRLRLT
jgi:hypothetical protein